MVGKLAASVVGALGIAASAQAHVSGREQIHRERSVLSKVARKAIPAVVAITTREPASSSNGEEQTGLGSGFIISADGYILTSQHVIEGATSIKVQLWAADGTTRETPATLVGQDKPTDSALLKIDSPHPLPVLELGRSDDVDVADWVVVIGNPFGLAHSVSVGVVSFKGRTDINPTGAPGYLDYLQTDASINPGSSGGPILDVDGKVVAIANAVNVSGQGIGFGIPIDVARAVLPQLRKGSAVQRAWMGVSVQDLSPELSGKWAGVMVAEVVAGGPASHSGLEVGDVITALDDAPVRRAQSLRWQVTTRRIGQIVRLNVERDGKPFATRIKLTELPPAELASAGDGATPLPLGAVVDEVDNGASSQAGLASPFGALVRSVRPGSVLAHAGLSRGDIVLKVNHSQIANRDALTRSLEEVGAGGLVRLFVRRGERTVVLEFKKP